ncbi:hypothetical protein FRC02_008946, partial [Tulasnella sp. 418]
LDTRRANQFPYFDLFKTVGGKTIRFKHLDQPQGRRLVHLVKDLRDQDHNDVEKKLLVKFTRRYSREAHTCVLVLIFHPISLVLKSRPEAGKNR